MEKKSKTVEMEAKPQSEKLSYEQLEQIANNLNRQCQQLGQQLRSAQNVIAEFNEVGMLLDILGKSEHFSEAFTSRCADKVEEIINKALDNAEKQEENN